MHATANFVTLSGHMTFNSKEEADAEIKRFRGFYPKDKFPNFNIEECILIRGADGTVRQEVQRKDGTPAEPRPNRVVVNQAGDFDFWKEFNWLMISLAINAVCIGILVAMSWFMTPQSETASIDTE